MTYFMAAEQEPVIALDSDAVNEFDQPLVKADRDLGVDDPTIEDVSWPDFPEYQEGILTRLVGVSNPALKFMDSTTRDADETLFHRVYVFPLEVDKGFITEETDDEITVWNANFTRTVDLTSVTVDLADGTEFDYPTLPQTIARGYDLTMTLTVLVDGPPIQDTDYTLVVDGFTFVLEVAGIRAIPLTEEPNWKSNPKQTYAFLTAIALNPRYFKEQRRPLTRWPNRESDLSFNVSDAIGRKFTNTLQYGTNKVFVVPIYTEQVSTDVINLGAFSITPTTDFSKFYNLNNNCTHVLMIDFAAQIYEVKELSSIAAGAFNFVSEIQNAFTPATTVIYPTFFATVQSLSIKDRTNDDAIVKVKFGEFKKSG